MALFNQEDSLYISACRVISVLSRAGYVAYFAGGAVRDALLDFEIKDIDIATDAHPDQVIDLFDKTIEVGVAFGVVIVRMDHFSFEVTTFRSDGNYLDGRRPESVSFRSSREDALRRDFTINGMFYDPVERKIIDYVSGQEDLEKSLIRCIGDPYQRLSEDKLRILRAIRFSSRYGFQIDIETSKAMDSFVSFLYQVSRERIGDEFKKMIEGPRLFMSLRQLDDKGLLEMMLNHSIQKSTLSLFEESVLKQQRWTVSLLLSFVGVCDHWSLEVLDKVVFQLCFSNRIKKDCQYVLNELPYCFQWDHLRQGERLYKAYHPLFSFLVTTLGFLAKVGKFDSSLYGKIQGDYRQVQGQKLDPFLNGEDFLKRGWLPSKELGDMLLEMTYLQLEGVVKSRFSALERLDQCQK